MQVAMHQVAEGRVEVEHIVRELGNPLFGSLVEVGGAARDLWRQIGGSAARFDSGADCIRGLNPISPIKSFKCESWWSIMPAL